MNPINDGSRLTRLQAIAIALALSLVFATMALAPRSMVASPAAMDAYFGGANPPGSWTWHGSWSSDVAPFAYRVVFKGAVDAVALLLNALTKSPADGTRTYWLAFLAVSLASFLFAAWALDRLLANLMLDRRRRALGLLFWLAMPSIHLAYQYPVQTKEDFFAYGLFFVGLRAVLRKEAGLVAAVALIGALTRETLILVPLLFVLTRAPLWERALPLLMALGTLLAVRLLVPASGHDPFFGLRETLANPLQSVVALFFLFGYGWGTLAAGLSQRREAFDSGLSDFWRLLPFALVALLGAHLLFGRIVEIRISSLLAPWIVVAAVHLVATASKPTAALASVSVAGVACLVLAFEASGIGGAARRALNPWIGQLGDSAWWIEWDLQLLLLTGVAVVSLRSRLASARKLGRT